MVNTKSGLGRYSMGVGDRFGREGRAQLRALQLAAEQGLEITPVWNKSHREHSIIGTRPESVREEADAAVATCGWTAPYFVDADHIGIGSVDPFLEVSDFFTIDVADFIGKAPTDGTLDAFVDAMRRFVGPLPVAGLEEPLLVTTELVTEIARSHLGAIVEAGRVYRYIAEKKGAQRFVTEVSLDETSAPQTPAELLFILAGLAREGIPVGTVAPKFSGKFLKGVDYVGDVARFAREFTADLAVLEFAKTTFGLPPELKLSIHSGSDKFSLYPVINRALRGSGCGVHLKTAGTTWLEELIGLASAGGEGLDFARSIYRLATARFDELARPYLSVIDIDAAHLPTPDAVDQFSSEQFVAALKHEPTCPEYNSDFRQLLHMSYRLAAERAETYYRLLKQHRGAIESHVTENILRRHVQPLFRGAVAVPVSRGQALPPGSVTRPW
jgi:hypothetical protein